jgi:hypothetical protein
MASNQTLRVTPYCAKAYSPECVEGEFSEVGLLGFLGTPGSGSLISSPIGPGLCGFHGVLLLRAPLDPTIVPFPSIPDLQLAASFSSRPGRCTKRPGFFYPPNLSISVLSITLIILARMTSTARATISLCMRAFKRTVSRRISSSA